MRPMSPKCAPAVGQYWAPLSRRVHSSSAVSAIRLGKSRWRASLSPDSLRFVKFAAFAFSASRPLRYTWAGMAEIKHPWVGEDHQGCGLGRVLPEAAIAEQSIGAANP